MKLEDRIEAFIRLGDEIGEIRESRLPEISGRASQENPWFTPDSVAMALKGIQLQLSADELRKWTSKYSLDPPQAKTIGVSMAGNIPLVGFHDFLCVLISGHKLKTKLSSKDSVLLNYLAARLIEIEPGFREFISFEERLNGVDAMIATGSNNTARYFEFYFRNIPHIIRKNRSSCTVLFGGESPSELTILGLDIFSYFGLGCRNVSKLYLPENYDFQTLLSGWEAYRNIIHHHKYFNNYEYQKSNLLVNKIPFYDNGFVLLKDDPSFVSPISVLYYEHYSDEQDLQQRINLQREKIQCIVSANHRFTGSEDFGKAQFPQVSDYADNVDTLLFLEKL